MYGLRVVVTVIALTADSTVDSMDVSYGYVFISPFKKYMCIRFDVLLGC